MASPAARRRAHHPADLNDLIADAINAGDLDAFLDARDADATVVVRPWLTRRASRCSCR